MLQKGLLVLYKMEIVNRVSDFRNYHVLLMSSPEDRSQQVKIASQKKRVNKTIIVFRLRRQDDHVGDVSTGPRLS